MLTNGRYLKVGLLLLVMNCTTLAQEVSKSGAASQARTVFVLGNVWHQRSLSIADHLTATQAIELAGGVKERSDNVRVRILRGLPGRQETPLVFTLKSVTDHNLEDPILQPGDIVEVSNEGGVFSFRYPPFAPPVWDPPLKPRRELIC
jgi:protein involved in polysaccharide export with SLBB domain